MEKRAMRIRGFVYACLFVLAGCGDPLTKVINDKWPPINVDQQRQAAIDTTAKALTTLTAPNIGVAVKLSDIRDVLFNEDMRKQGVVALKIDGDKQLVHLQIDFNRVFTQADAGDNPNQR
jgi:hypothetical protein